MALLTTSIPEGRLVSRGKVRDIYACGDTLVLVATDRISAYDCVLSPGIPGRGVILTRLSSFWFDRFRDTVPNHVVATELEDFPEPFRGHPELLEAAQAAGLVVWPNAGQADGKNGDLVLIGPPFIITE